MQQRQIIWEQLALYVTAMPCPPLPVMVMLRGEEGAAATTTTEGGYKYASSHDLIAGLVVMAMQRGRRDLNEVRKQKQIALTEALLCALEALPAEDDGSAAYVACQQFVGGYIHAFDDPGEATPSVRLVELDRVEKGDRVHSACCSWSAAQAKTHSSFKFIIIRPNTDTPHWHTQEIQHVAEVAKRRTAVDFASFSFRALLQEHARRVVASTPPATPPKEPAVVAAEAQADSEAGGLDSVA